MGLRRFFLALLVADQHGHSRSHSQHHAKRADTVPSFALYQPDWLDSSLGDSCIQAMSTNVSCVAFVRSFVDRKYRGTLRNKALTDSICTADCGSSLKAWFDSVTTACAGASLAGYVPTRLGGIVWEGWNETCVRDPRSKEYCNDIIANFAVVSNVTQMPRDQLCATCYVRRLALMQNSPYSVYDDSYKRQLEYVYSQCGGKGPTALPPSLRLDQSPAPPPPAPYCPSGTRYTTKPTDTCDSIAAAAGVSAAALYMANQVAVPDCAAIDPGRALCLPLRCQTYRLRATDSCTSIETALALPPGAVRGYNAWLRADCSNLQPATDFYGKTICVGPQGGTHTAGPAVPTSGGSEGGSRGAGGAGMSGANDGYARNAVAAPAGVEVARGTTRSCGRWHVVAQAEECSAVCVMEAITFNLFLQVNPSLSAKDCTASLKINTALCVGPTYQWNSKDLAASSTTAISSTRTGR